MECVLSKMTQFVLKHFVTGRLGYTRVMWWMEG